MVTLHALNSNLILKTYLFGIDKILQTTGKTKSNIVSKVAKYSECYK